MKKIISFLIPILSLVRINGIKIPSDYDSSLRPNNGAIADMINVSIENLVLRGVSDDQMEMNLDFILRIAWSDPRLALIVDREISFLGKNSLINIWTPDLYIVNSDSDGDMTNRAFKLKSDGSVVITERFSTKVSCYMSFIKFPFDKHECQVKFQSFAYTQIHLDLMWNGKLSQNILNFDKSYGISGVGQSSKSVGGGLQKNLILTIKMSRKSLPYLWKGLFPTLLLALSSYATLFLRRCCKITSKSKLTSRIKPTIHSSTSSTSSAETEDHEVNNRNHTVQEISSNYSSLILLRIALNAFFLLILVICAQINTNSRSRFGVICGIDVWFTFMSFFIILFLIQSVVLFYEEILHSNLTRKLEKRLEKIDAILMIGMPIFLFVFIIIYFAIYLS